MADREPQAPPSVSANRVAFLGEIEEDPGVLSFDALQERLPAVLAGIHREYARAFLVPPAATPGFPEFAAVLADLSGAYPVARRLAEEFHPLAVRTGAARGAIVVPSAAPASSAEASEGVAPGSGPLSGSEPLTPDQLEGPAFDAAAELLYRARKEDRMLLIEGFGGATDRLANTLILVLHRNLQGWTPRQCEVVRLYRTHGRQRRVAEELGVTQQSVSSSLAATGWKALVEAERCLATVLSAKAP
jgi:hypothetical protein